MPINRSDDTSGHPDLGIHYKCEIVRQGDLNRQLVKSSSCTVYIPQFEFTIPPGRGQLTTVEGILRDAIKDLSLDQPVRLHLDRETHDKIQALIDALSAIVPDDPDPNIQDDAPLTRTFTVEIDDPAGNSFVEFYESMADPQWHMSQFHRTAEQNEMLGLAPESTEAQEAFDAAALDASKPVNVAEAVAAAIAAPPVGDEEILVFPGGCPGCNRLVNTMMKKVNIPYFKVCIHCCCLCSLLNSGVAGMLHHVYKLRRVWI